MIGHGSIKPILQNNKNLLRKKSFFKKENSFLSRRKEYLKASKGEFNFKTISKEELQRIRKQIKTNRKLEEKKSIILFFMVFIPLLIVIFFIVNASINNEKEQIKISKELYIKRNLEKFNYLLLSGDEWMQKEKYYNAIFQYKLALKIFPENKQAVKKLLNVYTRRCVEKNFDCDKKEQFLKKRKTNSNRNAI